MDASTMMKTAAGIRFSGKDRPPFSIAMLHDVLAAAARTLLIYAAVAAGVLLLALLSIAVLIVAALIGAWINVKFHSQMLARMLALPIKGIVAHALVAVSGLALLLAVLFLPHSS